ncbi:MAG: regulatory protein RecX [Gammaproteobacteria bacterium]|nr:regulatory protein RecX [Gammaproteobacteria bacterium]
MSDDKRQAREYAIGALTRREHSRKELTRKLRAKGYDLGLIEPLLDQLCQEGLQSDTRYADSYLFSRIQKGYGPVRLRHELRERGIDDSTIEYSLDNLDIDWIQRVMEVREKKFGTQIPKDYKEQAKESRFLQYRGFTSEQIRILYQR